MITKNRISKAAQPKEFTKFRTRIRTRHPSHRPLRSVLPLLPFRSVIRLGSQTDEPNTISHGGNVVELNTIEGVRNSANKRLMKQCFNLAGVQTADWYLLDNKGQFYQQQGLEESPKLVDIKDLPYPIISKHVHGSRGEGETKLI